MFCDIMPDSLKRIAVILEGRVQYERNVLRGIREFAAVKGDLVAAIGDAQSPDG